LLGRAIIADGLWRDSVSLVEDLIHQW